MVLKYLSCDICGNKWNITNTNYADKPYPGTIYIHRNIKECLRTFIVQKGKVTFDDRLERDDMDICDKCYKKIDKFIYDLAKGGEEDG